MTRVLDGRVRGGTLYPLAGSGAHLARVLLLCLLGCGALKVASGCPAGCRCDPTLLKATCTKAPLDNRVFPPSLQHLDLSNNNLTHLPHLSLPNLLSLNLSHNYLTKWRSLHNVSASSLRILDASYNALGLVPGEDTALGFQQLQQLHLHHNHLNSLQLSTLAQTEDLHTVDLSFNAISTVMVGEDPVSLNLSHIHSLDLSYNALSELGCVEWRSLLDVRMLNLSHNRFRYIPSASPRCNMTTAQPLHNANQNHSNSTESLPPPGASSYHESGAANETYTILFYRPNTETLDARTRKVETIDLSHNELNTMHSFTFEHLHKLKDLRLNSNQLATLDPACFQDLESLEVLNLNANPIVYIPKRAFASCSRMQYLTMSHMPNLVQIHYDAFVGLKGLRQLIIRDNRLLQYMHASTLTPLPSLQVLDIQACAIDTIFPDFLSNTSALQVIYMAGNPLHCGCDFKWIYEWITRFNNTMPKFHEPDKLICTSPDPVANRAVSALQGFNFSCSAALIANVTSYAEALFKVGSPAMIDCVVEGEPHPQTTWITPEGHMVLHHPAYVDWLRPGPHHVTFHANHPWHDPGSPYIPNVPRSRRIHVLNNGSLYVDYMLRNDAGTYTCKATNPYGNQTVVIHVRLDYSILKWNVIISLAVGYACALGFFSIAVLIAVLRYIAYFCSAEQRQKRKSISEILASLDNYRHETFDRLSQYKSEKIDRLSQYKSEKIDRLSQYKTEKFDKISAYKTEKFDKLSAFKSAKFDQLAQYKIAKFDKLRSYKSLTFSTLVHYIKNMREYYIGQMVRIKENCAQQSEKLRDNYSLRTCAFKDYRSHKFDTLRENYAVQVLKIKEYGSSQMNKLREQYRTQQNHILKLIELMGIGNCMHIVEAECMRTESMLFDAEELNFDFDTHPVHVPPYFCDDDDDNESVYETAGSNIDISSSLPGNKRLPKILDQQQKELLGFLPNPLDPTPPPPHKKRSDRPNRHRKHKRCRHRRPINLPSFDDPDELDIKEIGKRKRRRVKEKRTATLRDHDDADTTAPDTPPEQRSLSAYTTVHRAAEPLAPSSEYDTASAGVRPSREVTPETRLVSEPKPIGVRADGRRNTPATNASDSMGVGLSTQSVHVAGSADVGTGHNVICSFTQTQDMDAPGCDVDLSPVHRPAAPNVNAGSSPTHTEHVILIDPEATDGEKCKIQDPGDVESTV